MKILSQSYTFSFHYFHTKWLVITGLLLCLLWLYMVDPQVAPSTPPCFFHVITNLDCPGCGTARACHQLLHGNLLKAMDYNLLFVLVIPFLFLKTLTFLFGISSLHADRIYRPKLILWVVIIFWTLRNIPGFPFTILSAGC